MKSFFPKVCPSCQQPLVVEVGDKSETLKLMCNNKLCCGSLLKRLQKGIIALEIRGLGPKVIENLMNAGITSSIDLFDEDIFNEKSLISSGYFRKGRSLEKIMTSVKSTKSIPLHKFILSLQIDNVGKTVSEKLSQLISGITPDFSGLPYVVRNNIETLTEDINKKISNVEKSGVKIIKTEIKKVFVGEVKKVQKCVAVENIQDILDVVTKLNWKVVSIEDPDCNMLVAEDKKSSNTEIKKAQELGVKIMTLNQIKLLFL